MTESVIHTLNNNFPTYTLFFSSKLGNKVTFDRDIAMQSFFLEKNGITWKVRSARRY
jgi:hypothetical protein